MASSATLSMAHGGTKNFLVYVVDQNGAAVDISAWGSFRATFKQNISDADVAALFTKTLGAGITKADATAGILNVQIVRADTVSLAYVDYSLTYDVWGVDGSSLPWQLVQDQLLIEAVVSRTSP